METGAYSASFSKFALADNDTIVHPDYYANEIKIFDAAGDFVTVFGETKANLRRFFNDADNDGWSVDGRHGTGRDWPHDRDGNDPDGWTSQIVVTVTRP